MVLKQWNLAEGKWHISGQETILVLDFYLCLSMSICNFSLDPERLVQFIGL